MKKVTILLFLSCLFHFLQVATCAEISNSTKGPGVDITKKPRYDSQSSLMQIQILNELNKSGFSTHLQPIDNNCSKRHPHALSKKNHHNFNKNEEKMLSGFLFQECGCAQYAKAIVQSLDSDPHYEPTKYPTSDDPELLECFNFPPIDTLDTKIQLQQTFSCLKDSELPKRSEKQNVDSNFSNYSLSDPTNKPSIRSFCQSIIGAVNLSVWLNHSGMAKYFNSTCFSQSNFDKTCTLPFYENRTIQELTTSGHLNTLFSKLRSYLSPYLSDSLRGNRDFNSGIDLRLSTILPTIEVLKGNGATYFTCPICPNSRKASNGNKWISGGYNKGTKVLKLPQGETMWMSYPHTEGSGHNANGDDGLHHLKLSNPALQPENQTTGDNLTGQEVELLKNTKTWQLSSAQQAIMKGDSPIPNTPLLQKPKFCALRSDQRLDTQTFFPIKFEKLYEGGDLKKFDFNSAGKGKGVKKELLQHHFFSQMYSTVSSYLQKKCAHGDIHGGNIWIDHRVGKSKLKKHEFDFILADWDLCCEKRGGIEVDTTAQCNLQSTGVGDTPDKIANIQVVDLENMSKILIRNFLGYDQEEGVTINTNRINSFLAADGNLCSVTKMVLALMRPRKEVKNNISYSLLDQVPLSALKQSDFAPDGDLLKCQNEMKQIIGGASQPL